MKSKSGNVETTSDATFLEHVHSNTYYLIMWLNTARIVKLFTTCKPLLGVLVLWELKNAGFHIRFEDRLSNRATSIKSRLHDNKFRLPDIDETT